MPVRIDGLLEGIDWVQAKADLAADDFDNGRTSDALHRSFQQSQHVAVARDGDRVVGMARLLSDGVCNAYLLDVWTASAYRRQGIASAAVVMAMPQLARAPNQRAGLLRFARLPTPARVLVDRGRRLARQRCQPQLSLERPVLR